MLLISLAPGGDLSFAEKGKRPQEALPLHFQDIISSTQRAPPEGGAWICLALIQLREKPAALLFQAGTKQGGIDVARPGTVLG